MVPENHEVANAIDAARSKISRRLEVTVRYDDLQRFSQISTPWGSFERETMQQRRDCDLQMMEDWSRQICEEIGITTYCRHLEEKEVRLVDDRKGQRYELRIKLELTAAQVCFTKNPVL